MVLGQDTRWSLGWRSQLLALSHEGVLEPQGDWWVLRSPGNPRYYWGNFLLTAEAPGPGDAPVWVERAQRCITALQPESTHVALGVDQPVLPAEVQAAWAAQGFEAHATEALVLEPPQLVAEVPPPRVAAELRVLRLPQETAIAVDMQVQCDDSGYEPAGYRRFRQDAMDRMARLQALGRGHWYGAFIDGALAAGCGLVHDGDSLGRFQHVDTHPRWRRLGLCRALVHHVARHAFDTLRLPRLVMCADPEDVAIGIYESVGFRRDSRHWGLQRRAPQDMPAGAR
jgi:RimJ/RimL family protein N-acetyltransferase